MYEIHLIYAKNYLSICFKAAKMNFTAAIRRGVNKKFFFDANIKIPI